jgi:transcriptional regulator with GAF, ATPase, and Fis domain
MIRTSAELLPLNEAERLHSLHQHEILHSLQEDVFDEIVILSAHLFGLPISYIGLVDAQHLHYKASYGFWAPPPQPRQELLCAQVIKRNQVVIYHDLASVTPMLSEARAIKNALTHQVQFYVGAPLRTANQYAVGTLCLVGRQPRAFSVQEQQTLDYLASVVSQLLVLRHQCHCTPGQGEDRWQKIREQVRDEVHGLRALVRYLLTRYGALVPVPEEVLHLMGRRLQDLLDILRDHAQLGNR